VVSSILPYIASNDWLKFRTVSKGCYRIVHDVDDVENAGNRGSESEALWRLALKRDFHFDKGLDDCLQSFHSPVNNVNIDTHIGDTPFLSTSNMFTAPNTFISWKHWTKVKNVGNINEGMLHGPYVLRACYMWQKIEQWCERSGEYGEFVKSSLVPGRSTYPFSSNSSLCAFQAVYAFYAGQNRGSGGIFGGFEVYGERSVTMWSTWSLPESNSQEYLVIAQGAKKAIALKVTTGQMYSVSNRNPQLVATPCPGGINCITISGRTHEQPTNIADGKDSILRWFEEYANRLHREYYAVGILNPYDDTAYCCLLKYPTVHDIVNCSRAVTRGIEIVASAVYVEEMDMFVYSIRMRLLTPDDGEGYMTPQVRGFETVQLVSRHWIITKLLPNRNPVVEEVRGEGVIGMYPILYEGGHWNNGVDEGGIFSYQSMTQADSGTIEGYLQFVPGSSDEPTGEIFNVRVNPFPLTFDHFLY
jgi:uncharacterized protein affecting Mg2+/Co2+ transport